MPLPLQCDGLDQECVWARNHSTFDLRLGQCSIDRIRPIQWPLSFPPVPSEEVQIRNSHGLGLTGDVFFRGLAKALGLNQGERNFAVE